PGFADLSARERLHSVIMRWFDALAPHRRVTGQMIATKLYPSHPHHWVPLIFNLSRTIQWVRDVALLDATGRQRQVEEIGLSALFLATLAVWSRDGSSDQEETREFLRRRLAAADGLMARMWGAGARDPEGAG
ncbi:MAG: TetR/AcrR family transcriptional regulator, partial [Alphaproteobacteria bacterium]|nr:TetR/AcrR family transcriptional regulator [Alphaproteobacteria bacterium]